MHDRRQLVASRVQFTGETLRGARLRLEDLDRYACLIPAASQDQAQLEAVLLDGLGRLSDSVRPLGIHEAIPATDALVLRLESVHAVRVLLDLLPHRSRRGPWRGVRQLTVRPDGQYLCFELRTRRKRYPHERPGSAHVRIAGAHDEDLHAVLAAHTAQVMQDGGTPHWDPAVAERLLTRREPLERDVLRQLAPATGLASLIVRRPRLWDSLAGYTHVAVSRERVDYGVDWRVDRPVDGQPHDQRLLDAWTDDVVGGQLGVVHHDCGPTRCVITLAPPHMRARSGGTLTITSHTDAPTEDGASHAARPLTALGDARGRSRPLRQAPSRRTDQAGSIVGLIKASTPESPSIDLPGTATQIAAVWAAQGFATGLIVIGKQDPMFDWALTRRRRRGEWPTERIPTTAARWSRLRLAPPPGSLWHLRTDTSDPQLSDVLAQARRDFDRVLLVEDTAWQTKIAQLGAGVDLRLLVLEAAPYPRSITLPPAPYAPTRSAQMTLSPRESALQWRLDHLGNGSALDQAPTGLLLLPGLAPHPEHPADDAFAREVEDHLALMGAQVMGRFPGRGIMIHGTDHSPHPLTVLDPPVVDGNNLVHAPHGSMEEAATGLAQRLWPAATVSADRDADTS
ncbi:MULTISPECIES: hypothetical protein [unclassified Streptomyces]|uniref:hypothetical protein n=1 Tax=unclassified Streptomyces TaxID=2593676 RepID=UPI000DBA2D96|nr:MULTISPECIES: hypothetical protein [unclassified Streptomyces]MYT68317.1 hypothetical protein [Streptomyces sp. SID8367]RAJ76953.1 hypothetical protein K377_06122 [Streptomyces sp. PsTaAH-137]